jgi:hypothetical protein
MKGVLEGENLEMELGRRTCIREGAADRAVLPSRVLGCLILAATLVIRAPVRCVMMGRMIDSALRLSTLGQRLEEGACGSTVTELDRTAFAERRRHQADGNERAACEAQKSEPEECLPRSNGHRSPSKQDLRGHLQK